MKKLLILGLLVLGLSSCGQSLDTTDLKDEEGEEVTVGTLNNDLDDIKDHLQDIEDCLEGLRESCMRAYKEGQYSGFPLYMADLKKITLIQFRGLTFHRQSTGIDSVTYKVSLDRIKLSWYHQVHVYLKLWDDDGAEIWATDSMHMQNGTLIRGEQRLDYTEFSGGYANNTIRHWQDSEGTFEWSSDTFTKFQVNWSDDEVLNKARVLARQE